MAMLGDMLCAFNFFSFFLPNFTLLLHFMVCVFSCVPSLVCRKAGQVYKQKKESPSFQFKLRIASSPQLESPTHTPSHG